VLTRLLTGLGALGAYGWMLSDPKRAYNTMFDLSDWLTGHVLTGRGTMETMLRNFVNDQMIDQAKAFLLGVAVATLLSVVFWPLSAGTRWVSGRMARAMGSRRVWCALVRPTPGAWKTKASAMPTKPTTAET